MKYALQKKTIVSIPDTIFEKKRERERAQLTWKIHKQTSK